MTTSVADTIDSFDQKRVANPEARKLDSYPLLDWLRFVLASIVALDHEGAALPRPIDGGLAVSVFLALSGWLIGGILLRSDRRDLPRFFFNRATRIWLPYVAAVAAVYGFAALRDGINAYWFKYLFYDTTFTHYTFTTYPRATFEEPLGGTGNHFWSISVEEQFYLFAPLLMMGLRWGKQLPVWVLIAAALLAIGSTFTPIALGVVAAILHGRHGDRYRHGARRLVAPLLAAAAFLLLLRWDMPQIRALFAVALVVALAIRGERGRIGLFLGAISYPLYLNHWMGAFVAHGAARVLPLTPPLVVVLSFAVALAAGTLAWALIDRPVLARRAGWYNPALGRVLGITAYALLAFGLAGGLAIRLSGG